MSEPTLHSLRAQGRDRFDPVRFHYLEALAQRLSRQPPAVQLLLRQRWQAAVADYAARAGAAQGPVPAAAPAADSPLARLNLELRARAGGHAQSAPESGAALPDMQSVRGFGQAWAKIAVEQQMAQACQRGPENAGPLNPHRLLLRSLQLMQALSPEYLQHFLAQKDALLWLEQGLAKAPAPAARRARRERRAA